MKASACMLCVGIDIAKASHVAALLSPDLLHKHGSFDRCPVLSFEQSRSGFEQLLAALTKHAPLSECHVLLEDTGHYGRALEQFLQEHGAQVYQVHMQRTRKGKQKSDKRDARALSVLLYNQVERRVLVADKAQTVYRLSIPSESAQLLRGLVQHRMELMHECVQRRNKLTAICDEIFPEFTRIYKGPNTPSALQLREKFPTPRDVAKASLDELAATRKQHRPSRAHLAELQELARTSIGTKDKSRLTALLIEQKQLIAELRMLDKHVDELNAEIEKAVQESREGRILISFPMIGPVQAGYLIAAIGSIANFESAAKLRAYCGWSPLQAQTGTSIDTMVLSKEGNRLLKSTIYLITLQAIKQNTPWRVLYNRLVPLKCHYDERVKKYRGRMKVVGRIAGQIIKVIYVLLRRDYDLVASHTGGELPPPELYDAKKHLIRK